MGGDNPKIECFGSEVRIFLGIQETHRESGEIFRKLGKVTFSRERLTT